MASIRTDFLKLVHFLEHGPSTEAQELYDAALQDLQHQRRLAACGPAFDILVHVYAHRWFRG